MSQSARANKCERQANRWIVEYDNDVGPNDEGYWEWWTVTNGDKSFKANTAEDAEWLSDLLNVHLSPKAGKASTESRQQK